MSITVAEALTLGEMKRCTLIAGAAGLSREVQCVDTMEMPDIYPWLQKHELLMTTGYSIQNEGERLVRLLHHLNNIEGAGLAITTQFVGQFTDEVKRLADELELPLIEIPSDVPFTALTNPIMKAIVDNQNKQLRFSEEIGKMFIDLEINGGGFQQISDALGTLLSGSVLVTDAKYCVLALSGDALPEAFVRVDGRGRARLLQDGWTRDGASRYRANGRFIACQRVFVRRQLRGYVLLVTQQEREDDYQKIALRHAVTSVALEFSKQKSLEEERQTLNNNLFLDLMLGSVPSDQEALARADGLSWPRLPLVLAVLDLARFEKNVRGKSELEIQELKERIACIVQNVLRDADLPAVLTVTSDMFNCLFSADCDPVHVRDTLTLVMERIRAECGLLSRAAVSRPIDLLLSVPLAQQECQDAMRVAGPDARLNVVFSHDVLPELVFMSMGKSGFCQNFARNEVDRIHLYDQENDAHLVETVAALYDCAGRKNETAARLFLHRNTLAYRLRKLQEITGLSMDDPRSVTTLGLAAKIFQYL